MTLVQTPLSEVWAAIAQHLNQVTGYALGQLRSRSVSGGCINQTYRLESADYAQHARSSAATSYFVKLNRAADVAMFQAESLGLAQLAATATIRVPRPVCWGTVGDRSYLVLEWLDLGSDRSPGSWERLGHDLAALHRWQPELGAGFNGRDLGPGQAFGWETNNTIGSTPQINTWTKDWPTFWAEYRLGYQLRLARRQGETFPLTDRVLAAIPALFDDYQPGPSLLHGDLWSGNAAIAIDGTPVIFDPATYWGDRETDLAMTELFGGFPTAFYRGYNDAWPVAAGYDRRKILYNLYHVLNHFNLFGGSYARANAYS